jgi:precorrin-6B methylase 2
MRVGRDGRGGRIFALLIAACLAVPGGAVLGGQAPYEPTVGMAGKDAVWVPTPPDLVEVMLDLAQVTPEDIVVDLGSGDGRMVFAAARRGARARGVEYNPDLVLLSNQRARDLGVADRATFVEGDMFRADISDATVLALFLLPSNLETLKTRFLELKPGVRIVMNTYSVEGWEPDAFRRLEGDDCTTWCNALLYIVPADAAGTWQFDGGRMTITQAYQRLGVSLDTGTGPPAPGAGHLRAAEIFVEVGGAAYAGRVEGDRITGTVVAGDQASARPWTATRQPAPTR